MIDLKTAFGGSTTSSYNLPMDINQFHPLHPQPSEPKPDQLNDKDRIDRERFVYLRDNLILINQRLEHLESIDRKLSAPNALSNIILVALAIGFIIAALSIFGVVTLLDRG